MNENERPTKREERARLAFECPSCGGGRWGTTNRVDDNGRDRPFIDWIGSCSDCGFSWPRGEDWKVFRLSIAVTRDEHARFRVLNRAHGEDLSVRLVFSIRGKA